MSIRGTDDPTALICDIDGTLFDDGTPRRDVIDYVNAFEGEVIIVTARFISNEQSTKDQLDGVVDYEELVMRTTDEPADVYKKNAARDLQQRFNVVAAIDNDETARVAYDELGIDAINPDEVGADGLVRSSPIRLGTIRRVSTNTVEQRYVDVAEIEVRAGAAGDGMAFTGMAAMYNARSEDLGGFTETIAPGAFSRSLKSRNEIRMYVNHNADMVLASRRAGTLRLTDTERGLRVEADLPDTSYARDLSALMKSNVVSSMSFGFSVPAKGDSWNAAGNERELRDVRLHEVSVVTGFPAYPQTTAHVRSLDVLAERTGLDAVRMNKAITKLEAGEELSADDAALLDEAIAKLKPVADEPVVDTAGALLMKKQQLDLAFHAA